MKIAAKSTLLVVMVFIVFGYGVKSASATVHPAGTNVISNGTVYMITDEGQLRAYTSEGAFLSYGFNSWASVQPASAEDLALPQGSFIPPRDGKVVCSDRGSDKGTCYLITNGKRAGFVSAEVFTALGFSFSKVIVGDVSFLEKDNDIASSSEQHRPGVLVNRNGTVYLVATNGLIGIPSVEVLKTWGYSFDDVVAANQSDSSQNQSSIMLARQGSQLKPAEADPFANASEEVILKSYIDSYPPLPTQEVSSPEDVAAILSLGDKTDIEGEFKDIYPYLSSQSITLLNKIPTIKKAMESESASLYKATDAYPTVKIFEGKTKALFTETITQQETNYSEPVQLVFVKENGTWKLDLIGSFKIAFLQEQIENPNDAFVTGSGTTDLSVIGMEYEGGDVILNDANAKFLVRLANNGDTTIEKFLISLAINDTDVYVFPVARYKLGPGQEIILSIPIASFWNPTLNRAPGQYKTVFGAGFDPATLDDYQSDNAFYTLTNFK